MFFMHLRTCLEFAATLSVLISVCGVIWLVRKRRNLLRVPVMVVGSPIALMVGLFFGLQLLSIGCNSYSAPLYSPKHDKLVRINNWDAGATGGGSMVELLTHHGFSSNYIYRGGWASVTIPEDVSWLDDTHIQIRYDPYQFADCESTKMLHVVCLVKTPRIPTGTLKSPDGNAVAEFHTAKDGTYEGTDAVILTGNVGYAYVYVGSPGSIVWSKTHWTSERKLNIVTTGNFKACSSQLDITVMCTSNVDQN